MVRSLTGRWCYLPLVPKYKVPEGQMSGGADLGYQNLDGIHPRLYRCEYLVHRSGVRGTP